MIHCSTSEEESLTKFQVSPCRTTHALLLFARVAEVDTAALYLWPSQPSRRPQNPARFPIISRPRKTSQTFSHVRRRMILFASCQKFSYLLNGVLGIHAASAIHLSFVHLTPPPPRVTFPQQQPVPPSPFQVFRASAHPNW